MAAYPELVTLSTVDVMKHHCIAEQNCTRFNACNANAINTSMNSTYCVRLLAVEYVLYYVPRRSVNTNVYIVPDHDVHGVWCMVCVAVRGGWHVCVGVLVGPAPDGRRHGPHCGVHGDASAPTRW